MTCVLWYPTTQVLGMNLTSNLTEIHKHCGYCPQFGGLIDTLTGREHLYMFARLRGTISDARESFNVVISYFVYVR